MTARNSISVGLQVSFAVTIVICLLPSAAAQDETSSILGVWRGSSVCVNRDLAPACKDEEIIYTFRAPIPPKPNTVILKADKVVNGEILPMGELEFSCEPDSKRWLSEFKSPRFHSLWSFAFTGSELSGQAIDVPSKAVLRNVRARKEPLDSGK